MEYELYKFHFSTAIHVGDGHLESSGNTIMADTLFSALCLEVLHAYGEERLHEFVDEVKKNKLVLSNMFPFTEDALLLPKPLIKVQTEQEGDSTIKKQFKKLKYISESSMESYLAGQLNPAKENELCKKLGEHSLRTLSSSLDEEKRANGEMLPYDVGVFTFCENAGLYVLLGSKSKELSDFLSTMLQSLSYSGIGGKRSAGFGRFNCEKGTLPQSLAQKLNTDKGGVLLSTAMAKEDELENTLQDASYLLLRRAGFTDGGKTHTTRRKRDFYSFAAGSYFKSPFDGDVVNVANGGVHPVYRYAKPLFLEV